MCMEAPALEDGDAVTPPPSDKGEEETPDAEGYDPAAAGRRRMNAGLKQIL